MRYETIENIKGQNPFAITKRLTSDRADGSCETTASSHLENEPMVTGVACHKNWARAWKFAEKKLMGENNRVP